MAASNVLQPTNISLANGRKLKLRPASVGVNLGDRDLVITPPGDQKVTDNIIKDMVETAQAAWNLFQDIKGKGSGGGGGGTKGKCKQTITTTTEGGKSTTTITTECETSAPAPA